MSAAWAKGPTGPSSQLVIYVLKGQWTHVVNLQCMCQEAYGPEWLVYTACAQGPSAQTHYMHQVALGRSSCFGYTKGLGGQLPLALPDRLKAPSYRKPWGTSTTAQVHTPALAMADTHNKTQYHSVHLCIKVCTFLSS